MLAGAIAPSERGAIARFESRAEKRRAGFAFWVKLAARTGLLRYPRAARYAPANPPSCLPNRPLLQPS